MPEIVTKTKEIIYGLLATEVKVVRLEIVDVIAKNKKYNP